MNLADRIQALRKSRGISQEELAEKVGVSRQAVSKWESEQSIPDIDKIIFLSEFFDVTTDYLLSGIEREKQTNKKTANANLFVVVGTALNGIGLVVASSIWYEKQEIMAVAVGLVFMVLGCMVFGVGMYCSAQKSKVDAVCHFWEINIWILAFLPLSFVYNNLFTGLTAPYPILSDSLVAFLAFWLIYLLTGLSTVALVRSKTHGKSK